MSKMSKKIDDLLATMAREAKEEVAEYEREDERRRFLQERENGPIDNRFDIVIGKE